MERLHPLHRRRRRPRGRTDHAGPHDSDDRRRRSAAASRISGGRRRESQSRTGVTCRWQSRARRVVAAGSVSGGRPGPPRQGNVIAAVLIVLFGFFFVTVSSRITGLIGSSSNPISGMTIATLILTCPIFVAGRLGRRRLRADRTLGSAPSCASPPQSPATTSQDLQDRVTSSAQHPFHSRWVSSSA